MAVIPKFKTFEISLRLSNLRVQGGRVHSVFHVMTPGSNSLSDPGNRLAWIHFQTDGGGYLQLLADMNQNGGPLWTRTKRPLENEIVDGVRIYKGPWQFQFILKRN